MIETRIPFIVVRCCSVDMSRIFQSACGALQNALISIAHPPSSMHEFQSVRIEIDPAVIFIVEAIIITNVITLVVANHIVRNIFSLSAASVVAGGQNVDRVMPITARHSLICYSHSFSSFFPSSYGVVIRDAGRRAITLSDGGGGGCILQGWSGLLTRKMCRSVKGKRIPDHGKRS
jgi:hypothetical protein